MKKEFLEQDTLQSNEHDNVNVVVNENQKESINDDFEIDFSLVENPLPPISIGIFKVKEANEWIDESKYRHMPSMLFGQLWFENEVCILFSDSNLGKSILAVQIADGISRGYDAMDMCMNSYPQTVLYFDFELTDKQFELRYTDERGNSYQFSPNLKRVEINPDKLEEYSDVEIEEYIKMSLEETVKEYESRIIILDNITYLSSETEKAKGALPLMRWLKSFAHNNNLSILVLAHTPKRIPYNPITKNDLQGSKMLYNFCDSCFAIGESNKGKNYRYIKELKQRNTSFQYDADNVLVCEIVKKDNFLMFDFLDFGKESDHLRSEDREGKRNYLIERVKELTAQGMSQREISQKLDISKTSVLLYQKK